MKKRAENQPIFLTVRGRALRGRVTLWLGLVALALAAAVSVRYAGAGRDGGPLVIRQAELPQRAEESAGVLRINDAAQAELEALPGIGPVLAGRLVAWREENGPFRAREDILAVEGIGEGIFEKIRPYITFESGKDSYEDPGGGR